MRSVVILRVELRWNPALQTPVCNAQFRFRLSSPVWPMHCNHLNSFFFCLKVSLLFAAVIVHTLLSLCTSLVFTSIQHVSVTFFRRARLIRIPRATIPRVPCVSLLPEFHCVWKPHHSLSLRKGSLLVKYLFMSSVIYERIQLLLFFEWLVIIRLHWRGDYFFFFTRTKKGR